MVTVGKKFSIDFKDESGNVFETLSYDTGNERDAVAQQLQSNDAHPLWPQTAVKITIYWQRIERTPIFGVDYGVGSVKRRFGNGRVPRGAYRLGRS